jgi:glycosyltransferase involved in cell wall biosynthesis
MKIAHFHTAIYEHGGVSAYIGALARLQEAAGNEVFRFETTKTINPNGKAGAILIADEAELFLNCTNLHIDVLHYHTSLRHAAPPSVKVIRTVHEHSPHCISGGLFLKRHGLPCPRTYHPVGCAYGHLWDHCGSLRPRNILTGMRRLKAQQKLLPRVTVVCVGAFLKSRMMIAGYPGSNIHVVPNFTDVTPESGWLASSGPPAFLFMGRLEKLKGVEWLLRSFAQVKTDAILNIAGEGQELDALKALAETLQIGRKVKFLGWVQGAAKLHLLRRARALIVPSIWHETFGIVAIEAAALSRAVICSDAGELPYIIGNGREGIVVEAGHISQLTHAIETLADNQETAGKMGALGHLRYKALYTPEIHLRAMSDLYESDVVR